MEGFQTGTNELLAKVVSNDTFRCPVGVTLTAVDQLIVVLPGALLDSGAPIESVFEASDDAELRIEFDEQLNVTKHILVRLRPLEWLRTRKACEVMVLTEDGFPKQLKITRPNP